MARVVFKNVAENALNLDVQHREFVVLAGPAGCGSSALLRMIAGLDEIPSGEIFIGERRINDLPAKDRDVAMVFQSDALYPGMSAYDNMAVGLKRRSFAAPAIKKRVESAAEILGLGSSLRLKPEALSPELRLRVALGRAIVRQPKVFLFDNPFACLESRTRAQMRMEIARLHQRLETTMIFATHDPVEAMAVGNRLVMMNNGAVQQDNATRAVYDAPGNLLVAGFLGRLPMNFIHGTLKQEREALLFTEQNGGTIEARVPAAERPALREFIGKPLVLGIRPEDLRAGPFTKGLAATPGSFPALLDYVEPTGGGANLHAATGAHTVVCRVDPGFDPKEAGRRVQFTLDLQKAHFFDPVSTLRIT